ncbi:MAG: hypothetical protein HND52_07095 [Ignavibacteriae bacterium]|nr:hypothetical protein [Ignavibacteriota bacterium]NOG97710.1 hypothetical protein [Ignavibacteriota bacterium]
MKFLNNVLELYDLLVGQNSNLDKINSLSGYLKLIDKNLYSAKLKENFKIDMHSILDERLKFCSDDIDYLRKLKDIAYYEDSMAVYSTIIIFWAKYNNAGLTNEELSKLSEATFIGVIGYKLIDIHNDENVLGKEASILGNYLIHIHEEILLDIFKNAYAMKTINKYVGMYAEAEFLEKRNRWKQCPFDWEYPQKIGWKAAPLFAIFELLFLNAAVNEREIEKKIDGLILASAALQMADDFMDSVKDLNNGIETLIMSGFYELHGNEKEITIEMVDQFLEDEKVMRFYDTIQKFYDSAREMFNGTDDILSLFLELQNYRFNKSLSS